MDKCVLTDIGYAVKNYNLFNIKISPRRNQSLVCAGYHTVVSHCAVAGYFNGLTADIIAPVAIARCTTERSNLEIKCCFISSRRGCPVEFLVFGRIFVKPCIVIYISSVIQIFCTDNYNKVISQKVILIIVKEGSRTCVDYCKTCVLKDICIPADIVLIIAMVGISQICAEGYCLCFVLVKENRVAVIVNHAVLINHINARIVFP